jgi:glycolate dehydrogenase FAD-binding subunit
VKNVAGYDLPKLATGAMGTLGVITRAVFRLHPLPRNTRTLTIATTDAAESQRMVLAILGAQLVPAAVQVRNDARKGNVDILLEGTVDGIAAQEASIKRMGAAQEGSPDVWRAREEMFGTTPIVKFTTLPSRISAAAALFSHCVIQATGIGYAQFDGDLASLRRTMEQDGGSLVILGRSELDSWGSAGDALPLMRAVKQQFDPKGTLNPGRFVGGI